MCVWDVLKIADVGWKIKGWVVFDEQWGSKNFGAVVHLNPIEDPLAAARQRMELLVDRREKLRERFPDLPIESITPTPPSSVLCYGFLLILVVYGAPRPLWNDEDGVWWHSREKPAWDWVKTVKDVEGIKVPRWEDEPEVRAMFKQRETLERAFPGQRISLGAPVERGFYENLNQLQYPNFIDLAPHLLGNTRSFRILVSEPELAHALMDKCFEISTSYSEFLMWVDDVSLKDLDGLTLGGDYSATLSPKIFAEYSNGWSRMVLNHFKKIANRSGDPPCNIHSCGPSTHLYEEFSKIPNVIGIETRGVIEGIEKLREALPKAHLNITFAPPQVNFESISPEDVRSIMWKFVKGAGFRDISLHAWCPAGTPDENVRGFYQTLQEINNSI